MARFPREDAAVAVSGVSGVGVKGGLLVGLAVALVAMAGLGLAQALHVELLLDPLPQMRGDDAAGRLGVALLVADVVAPVPASLIMLGHGALFGVPLGAALSLVGRTGNAIAGLLLGRGVGSLASRRESRRGRAGEHLVERWGLLAVMVARPVPVLAESTLVAAGAMRMPAAAVVLAAVMGSVPEAVLYALAGSAAASFVNGAVVFIATLVLAGGAWAVGASRQGRTPHG